MENSLFDMEYYGTYYYANVVQNILCNQFAYLRNLNDFYGDGRYVRFLESYQPYSAFHQFIEFVIENLLFEQIENVDLDELRNLEKKYSYDPDYPKRGHRKLPIGEALEFHSSPYITFEEWLENKQKEFSTATNEDVHDYYEDLCDSGVVITLVRQLVEEVFFVMFLNREALKTV